MEKKKAETMQAILKSKDKLELKDDDLEAIENDLFECYNLYMGKREDLREIIRRYEEKQSEIRNKVKQSRYFSSQ